jgi:hypothetical protein
MFALRVAFALVVLLVCAPTAAAQTVVSPGFLADWQLDTSPDSGSTASTVFEAGPSAPPVGVGSLELKVGSDGGHAAEARYPELDGTRLDALTGLSYWTFYESGGTGSQAPYVILQVDNDDNGTVDDQLFFEPFYQSGFSPSDVNPQPALVQNSWQFWNARQGGWYSLNAGTFGPPLVSLDTYLASHPDAEIRNSAGGDGGLRLVAGFGSGAWDDFVGNVDAVQATTSTFSQTFDFEPDTDDDSWADVEDNCPSAPNDDQVDTDGDGQGDACDVDDDGDGLNDDPDNCNSVANPDQVNTDGDGEGDACDADDDNDGISDLAESALGTSPTDSDADDDGVNDGADTCPRTAGNTPNGCPGDVPEDAPPAVQITAPAANTNVIPGIGVLLDATAADDRGVTRVTFVDADGVICTDETAPYSCRYLPTGDDVGKNTVIAVATDVSGQTGTDSRRLNVERFKSGAVSLSASPARDRSAPYRFTLSGKVTRPAGVSAAQGCRGTVVLRINRGGKSAAATNAPLSKSCTYKRTLVVPSGSAGALSATARFNGNAVLLPRSARTRAVRAG